MRPLSPRRPITGRLGTRHLGNTPFQRSLSEGYTFAFLLKRFT